MPDRRPEFGQSDLFQTPRDAPLAQRLRPSQWEELVGHSSLLERLRRLPPHSLILAGPPGTGKTTIATILASHWNRPSFFLSAVSCGVKEVRQVLETARNHPEGAMLFLDEIHRFNKAQQDSLLESAENGRIVLIGATTENPRFEVIGPLLSRCTVYYLEKLGRAELSVIAQRVLEKGFSSNGLQFGEGVLDKVLEAADGDARRLIRILENLATDAIFADRKEIKFDGDLPELSFSYGVDDHYDTISAFIKSIRGSDPDAALLYLAVMLQSGEDPAFIARRLVILASEDVGNASPSALPLAMSVYEGVKNIGMPEARILLAQAVTFLAASPKSNASYLAMDRAMEAVSKKRITVPAHLKNRTTGKKASYLYPHDYPGHYVEQSYFPVGMEEQALYQPDPIGQEERIRQKLEQLRPGRYRSSAERGSKSDSQKDSNRNSQSPSSESSEASKEGNTGEKTP
ncbi:MAG: replication-associated recombination protein A [Leptospiraceae bacterium]|nr:replication-associated recombination protein A [Leptospiraceae bacterium]